MMKQKMNKKKKTVIARPINSLKGLEVQYRRDLMKLGRSVAQAVRLELLPMLKSQQSEYVSDGIAANIANMFVSLNNRFTSEATAQFALVAANQAVTKTEVANKKRFNKSIKAATGIDVGSILSTEGLEEFTQLNISNNVSLIKSLPEQYLKSVETIVSNGVSSGARYSTIEKQITAKLGSANSKLVNRIKTIASDQIQTINSQIGLRRSEKLGIKRGIFRTAEDERVRRCHAELNGKEYDLSKGAWSKTCSKYIQPGITDINCRCSYSPIIELD